MLPLLHHNFCAYSHMGNYFCNTKWDQMFNEYEYVKCRSNRRIPCYAKSFHITHVKWKLHQRNKVHLYNTQTRDFSKPKVLLNSNTWVLDLHIFPVVLYIMGGECTGLCLLSSDLYQEGCVPLCESLFTLHQSDCICCKSCGASPMSVTIALTTQGKKLKQTSHCTGIANYLATHL